MQYADFAVWQRNAGPRRPALDYWREQLAGITPLELPTDRPRPAVRTAAGAMHEFELPTSAALTADDGTLFMALVAACQVLLARYSGQEDIAIGTVTSGRERAELEHWSASSSTPSYCGPLWTPRGRSSRSWPTCGRPCWTRSRTRTCRSSGSWTPSRPDRDTSRNPLFDVMVLLQNTAEEVPRSAGLDVEEVQVPVVTSTCDLTFEFQEQGSRLRGAIEYNTDLFDASTIERMARHLVVLLTEGTTDPLDATERELVLQTWNDTAREVPDPPFPQIFEAQARRTPDATALVCGDERLTFAELNARANRLAHQLIAAGAGPEQVVALRLPRTADFVVALLAILKAGAVYLPVDPDLPADRVEFLLRDANPVLVLDSIGDLTAFPSDDPDVVIDPSSAAYVIYTSGSTGQPKGVAVEHRNLTNLVVNHRNDFAFGGRLKVALSAVFSFDTSWEGPVLMAAGHELHVLDDTVRLDPDALVYVRRHARHHVPRPHTVLPPATDPRRTARTQAKSPHARWRSAERTVVARASGSPCGLQLLRPHRVHGRRDGRPHPRTAPGHRWSVAEPAGVRARHRPAARADRRAR